jgi:hypothetical protein
VQSDALTAIQGQLGMLKMAEVNSKIERLLFEKWQRARSLKLGTAWRLVERLGKRK